NLHCFPTRRSSDLFNNHSEFSIFQHNGTDYRRPWKDKSFLNELIINGTEKYTFEYAGSNLKKIHYPTGGTKEFFKQSISSNSDRCWYNLKLNGDVPGYVYGFNDAIVDRIITSSESNTSIEEFSYNSSK